MKKGILDPSGKNLNPLTNKEYSEEYKTLAKTWSEFPAYHKAKEILKTIKDNRVILVVSGTGSGKTVLIPKFALHSLDYNGKIAITLPKQIIAKSAAEFAAKTLDVKLGEEVGYQYKGSPKNSKSDKTKLLYATDGTLVSRLINDPMLKDFDTVIMDEIHERRINSDLLLLLLKETLQKRPEFKLIIMSATINSDIFKNYYKDYDLKVVNISGESNYPITSIYTEEPINQKKYLEVGIKTIIKLAEINDGDILFFITSSNEAIDVCTQISDHFKDNKKVKPWCVEVYSGMDEKKKMLAQDKSQYKENTDFTVKVVIATNVAESSLTIDGIKYVIESGYELMSSYDPESRARKLDRERISKAQVRQRMGRAGRTQPGICYHLYTQDEFAVFKDYPDPDIRKSNITKDLLKLLFLDRIQTVTNLQDLLNQFIEPPTYDYVDVALDTLRNLYCIADEKITDVGTLISRLSSIEVELGFALIVSNVYQCSHEVINIISMLYVSKNNMNDIFIRINEDKVSSGIKTKYNKAKSKFNSKSGDHMSLLKIYDEYNNANNRDDWCYKNFVKCKQMRKAKQFAMRLHRDFGDMKEAVNKLKFDFDLTAPDSERKRILTSLMHGYRLQIANRNKHDKYDTDYAKNATISRSSYLRNDKIKTCFYSELFISHGMKELNIVSLIHH